MRFRYLFLLLLGISCAWKTVAPTPILISSLTRLNNEVVQLYVNCSEEVNYNPDKESCDSVALETKTKELLDLSEEFISADIKQPQGYDIYLATAMIYFRISQRNMDEYTKAEQIARQFFEVQKAHSGRSVTAARFYWAWFAAAAASKQYYEEPLTLNLERKAELLLALGEGTAILNEVEGPRLVRLQQALQILEAITGTIR